MRVESPESTAPLRTGFTTGACATACALAAARLLLGGESTEVVTIILPKGQQPEFSLHACELQGDRGYAATIKDAGDDPDVTHGALVQVWVELIPAGIEFMAGAGVGMVTRAGLPIPPGEPAINPVPRNMINEHLQDLAAASGYGGGFRVTIGVENGAELATKTMNPRLGIVGGLSILGTTGIVRPFSCSAYIASIHQAMDVAKANGINHIAACTGNSSEIAARKLYGLPDMALIEMGDFVGAVLKYLKKTPFQRVSL
ncbi:MAG: cobalt-precorrin-5B (C(1))-methyltransferase, partial [Gammaproteobacteria bacterium]|nr:cobalt-precorrin-5B (C(1))-methyltransferase [Gammaproteobacteria bacterium]